MRDVNRIKRFVICVTNKGYEVSLEKWKLYPVVNEEAGMLRIIDESGESYLYEKEYFNEIEVPVTIEQRYTEEIII